MAIDKTAFHAIASRLNSLTSEITPKHHTHLRQASGLSPQAPADRGLDPKHLQNLMKDLNARAKEAGFNNVREMIDEAAKDPKLRDAARVAEGKFTYLERLQDDLVSINSGKTYAQITESRGVKSRGPSGGQGIGPNNLGVFKKYENPDNLPLHSLSPAVGWVQESGLFPTPP